MDQEEKYIGYLKYSGKSVDDGFMDARKSAEALLGFDEILRFFLLKEDHSLRGIDFEIPVKIEKGSWIAAIPENINQWILTGGGVIATAYLANTAKQAAEKGILNTGTAHDIKKSFKLAMRSAQWMIKISLHMGTLVKKRFEGASADMRTGEIKIPNEQGEYLNVPKKYLDLYVECPIKIFSKTASVVEKERMLEFGLYENGKEERVSITEKEKSIYYREDEDEGVIFPELKHGQYVELEGIITRGNERTNTIGFEYDGHVLTCKPGRGNIVQFKNRIVSKIDNHIFPRVKIIGVVDRESVTGEFKEKKPRIIFSEIVLLEKENKDRNFLKF